MNSLPSPKLLLLLAGANFRIFSGLVAWQMGIRNDYWSVVASRRKSLAWIAAFLARVGLSWQGLGLFSEGSELFSAGLTG